MLRAYAYAYLALTAPKLLALATTVLKKKDSGHQQKLRQVSADLTSTILLLFLIQLAIAAYPDSP